MGNWHSILVRNICPSITYFDYYLVIVVWYPIFVCRLDLFTKMSQYALWVLGFDCWHYHPSKIITAEVMIERLLFLQVEEMFFIFLHDILPFARICCSPFFPLMLIIFQLAMVSLSNTAAFIFSYILYIL